MLKARIVTRHEYITVKGINKPFRIIHISDVHFGKSTTYEENQRTASEILAVTGKISHPDVIAVTGDLVSRATGCTSEKDADLLLDALSKYAPIVYSLGNHETDLRGDRKHLMLRLVSSSDKAAILQNQSKEIDGVHFVGLELPRNVFVNEKGGYSDLKPITKDMITECVGECTLHPCVLLAHSPMGFPAYAEWGADVVLSGHVHGGMIRIGNIGLLSPERRFFPKYTKGLYHLPGSVMHVSAGIGKLRFHNPPEIVCIDLIPDKEG